MSVTCSKNPPNKKCRPEKPPHPQAQPQSRPYAQAIQAIKPKNDVVVTSSTPVHQKTEPPLQAKTIDEEALKPTSNLKDLIKTGSKDVRGEATGRCCDDAVDGKTNTTPCPLPEHKARSDISQLEQEKKELKEKLVIQERELQELLELIESRTNSNNLLIARQGELQKSHRLVTMHKTYSFLSIQDDLGHLNQWIDTIAQKATIFPLNNTTIRKDSKVIEDTVGLEYMPLLTSHVLVKGTDRIMKAILQIFLCGCVHQALCSWSYDESLGNFLREDLYNHIFDTEEDIVARKWKDMTCKQVQFNGKSLDDHTQEISTSFLKILSFFGWIPRAGAVLSIGSDIQDLVHNAKRVGKMMKTGVITYRVQPVKATYGEIFDRSRMVDMSNEFGICVTGSDSNGKLVLGTTGIGCYTEYLDQKLRVVVAPRVILQPRCN